jgi:YVTN family beta-propeller protein
MRGEYWSLLWAGLLTGLGCSPVLQDSLSAESLQMADAVTEPDYVRRSRPKGLALSADESLLFVGQEGDLVHPATQLRVLDAHSGKEVRRISLGVAPQYPLLSPDGSKLYVSNRFSNFLSVVDTTLLVEVGRIWVSYYSEKMALSQDGTKLYVANRWLGGVEVIELAGANATYGNVVKTIKTWKNPRDLVVGPDDLVYVGNLGGTSVSLIDPVAGTEVDRLWTNSPVNALAADSNYVFVGTLGRGDGHPMRPGMHSHPDPTKDAKNYGCKAPPTDVDLIPDGNVAGKPTPVLYRGDTTRALGFGDINNDLMVLGGRNTADHKLKQLFRYTSDTAEATVSDKEGYCDESGQNCAHDYTPEEMIVVGAMPEQMTVRGNRLYVTMSASDQMVMYDIAPTALPVTSPLIARAQLLTRVQVASSGPSAAEQVCDTGINPFGIVVTKDGKTVYTANRLGDTISKINAATCLRTEFQVGDDDRPYPKTDYEKGEMLFHSAKWSSEALPNDVYPKGAKAGDKTCNSCHRESYTDGKLWSVGIGRGLVYCGGERVPPRASNLRDTDALFWEGVQHPRDFDLEGNEFTLPKEFETCRGVSDVEGETKGSREDLEGSSGPVPSACRERDQFINRQFGEEYNFNSVSRHFIGAFLTGRQRILPNPDKQAPTPEKVAQLERGRQLFVGTPEAGGANCAACHPVDRAFTINLNLPRVISESGLDNGRSLNKLRDAEQDGRFNVPSLRFLFDRPAVLLHDGRAKSLKSAILGPGHVALHVGEDGCHNLAQEIVEFNQDLTRGALGLPRPVFNGSGCNQVAEAARLPAAEQGALGRSTDTHGVTSQLSADQVDDLLAFVLSLEE